MRREPRSGPQMETAPTTPYRRGADRCPQCERGQAGQRRPGDLVGRGVQREECDRGRGRRGESVSGGRPYMERSQGTQVEPVVLRAGVSQQSHCNVLSPQSSHGGPPPSRGQCGQQEPPATALCPPHPGHVSRQPIRAASPSEPTSSSSFAQVSTPRTVLYPRPAWHLLPEATPRQLAPGMAPESSEVRGSAPHPRRGPRQAAGAWWRGSEAVTGRGSRGREALVCVVAHASETRGGHRRRLGAAVVAKHHGAPWKGDNSGRWKAHVKPRGPSEALRSLESRTEKAQTKPKAQQSERLKFKED